MAQRVEPRVGDGRFLLKIRNAVNRTTLKRRDFILEQIGQCVATFTAQIGAEGLSWTETKKRLGEEGWQTSVLFTKHIYMSMEARGEKTSAMPWRLITISLCPAQRATDASYDQLKWLDDLIAEAQRHCARLERLKKAS